MTFKEYLLTLRWNTFAIYPDQGSDIYVLCRGQRKSEYKLVKVTRFNAVDFDFTMITPNNLTNQCWQYFWLPAIKTEKQYVKSISN